MAVNDQSRMDQTIQLGEAGFSAALSQRDTEYGTRNTNLTSLGDGKWIPDGATANVWKRVEAGGALFAVDLKGGSSLPPSLRQVGIGPNDQAAGNVARSRAIAIRDKVKGYD